MNKIDSNSTSSGLNNYYSNNQISWNIIGVKEADNGNFKKALKSFSKAIEVDPKNFVSYFNRASIKMRLGDLKGAIKDFRLSEKLESGRSLEN